MFGLTELARLKWMIGIYDSWFASPDTGTVVLVMVVASLIYLAMFSLLVGGRARMTALQVLGLLALSEVHHLVETIAAVKYTPGLVTSIPYAALGWLTMRAAGREHRADAA